MTRSAAQGPATSRNELDPPGPAVKNACLLVNVSIVFLTGTVILVHFDLFARLPGSTERPLLAVLHVDPQDSLFAMLKTWPGSTTCSGARLTSLGDWPG